MVSVGSELGAHSQKLAFGGESRIRTCEARSAADLQSAAINHSAISPEEPYWNRVGSSLRGNSQRDVLEWSPRADSNR